MEKYDMIKKIKIENIKGIRHKEFDLNIIPNKPSILVAPNGFGKSSLAVAFASMNNSRIKLDKENLHEGNESKLPKITLELERQDGTTVTLEATNSTNTISGEVSYFVINNRTFAKGKGSQHGQATGSMEIKPIILIERVPNNIVFNYQIQNYKQKFGKNGKVLTNLSNAVFNNLVLIKKISSHIQDLQKVANGQRIQTAIDNIISQINTQSGTEQQLLNYIKNNHLQAFQNINHLNTIANIVNQGLNDEIRSYLSAIQLVWLYTDDADNFKKACEYNNYKQEKQKFEKLLSDFNCTWKNIKAKETHRTHRQLVVEFPKATEISNGQRDILTFISMIFKAEFCLNKDENILIIDEVFDYLDDANLIAAQYYITKFIDNYKQNGKNIYPLILTHLNPVYFKNFVFNNQKIYYLDNISNVTKIQVSEVLKKILRNRDKENIKNNIAKYFFHYNPQTIDISSDFNSLNIPKEWGENAKFIDYLYKQKDNYLNEQTYDPLAVCGALRIKIEEIAYNKLQNCDDKKKFIGTHTTREKLEFAETKDVSSPETHYLLGIIYNEGMHWKDNIDNISPIVSKLENLVIKNLIKGIFKIEMVW